MLAAVTRSPGEMVVGDVTGPGRARAGHVIVRPERVGICGSDFHLFSGDVGALSGSRDFYPRIQGHEVSAIVEDPGDSETSRGRAGRDLAAAAVRPLLSLPHRAAQRLPGLPPGRRAPRRRPGRTARGPGRPGLRGRRPGSGQRVLRRARLGGRARAGPRPAAGRRAGGGVRRRARSAWPRWSPPSTPARGCCRSTRCPAAATWPSASAPRSWPGDPPETWPRRPASGPAARGRRSPSRPAARPACWPRRPRWCRRPAGSWSSACPRGRRRCGRAPSRKRKLTSSARAAPRPGISPQAIRLVAANRAALAPVFSHHFPLARAAEAFEFAMSRPPDAIKIVVTVN